MSSSPALGHCLSALQRKQWQSISAIAIKKTVGISPGNQQESRISQRCTHTDTQIQIVDTQIQIVEKDLLAD